MAASMGKPAGMKVVNVIRNNAAFLRKCLLTRIQISQCRRGYAVERNSTAEIPDCEFRVLVIPGHTKLPQKKRDAKPKQKEVPPARYKKMRPDQDWTQVWPAAETFKWSVVPFPVRQGMAQGEENEGIPPGKYANAELMKIPNFLHLTPAHIKKHCQLIKEFCTPWPAELDTDEKCDEHFPITVETADYLTDGPSIRDARARTVTLTVPLSALELDYHARDKLLRLSQDCYDQKQDKLILTSDRCPLKKQNYDYTMYLLTALFHESWKWEDWESEKAEADMERYFWDIKASRRSLITTLRRQREFAEKVSEEGPMSELAQLVSADTPEEEIVELELVNRFKHAVTDLHDNGEGVEALNAYKETVKKLLLPTQAQTS